MFEVKFGTPKQVTFREYSKYGDYVMDIDLDARFAGKCEVSDYDHSLYADDEAVSLFIKSRCCEILAKCLNNWTGEKSVMRSYFSGLDGMFSTELKNHGITAKTEIALKNLTPDSEAVYKEWLKTVTTQSTNCGWDHMNVDPDFKKPEGTFMVSPVNGAIKYKDDRVFYKPGEHVEAVFWGVGTDTSYHVTANAPDLDVLYGSTIRISFTMPDHDVYISIGAESVMTPKPLTGFLGFPGMMGIDFDKTGTSAKQPFPNPVGKTIVSDGSEWTCPNCGAKNTGRFCPECGGVRPQ